jgi:uncharacterized membrane protein
MAKNTQAKVRPTAAKPQMATVQSVQLTQQTFQGPVPPPSILEGYEKLSTGSTDRIFKMAELEQAHRHALEAAATNANISAQAKQLELAAIKLKSDIFSDRIGQITGFIAALISIGCATYFGSHGEPWLAAGFIGVPLIGLVNVFKNRPTPDSKK